MDCVSVFLRDDEQLGFISFGTVVLRFWSVQSLVSILPVPVPWWLSRQEVQRSSSRQWSLVWVGCPGVDYIYFHCFDSLKFVKTYRSSLNVDQNKLKSSVCKRDSVVFWRTLLKVCLTHCWTGSSEAPWKCRVAPSAWAAHSHLEQESKAVSLHLAQLSWLYCWLGFWSVDLPH